MSLTRQVEEFREENTINSKERLTLDPNTTRKAPATGPNSIIQAEQAMQQAARQAKDEDRDPSRMLRVLAVLAAPVFDPEDPEHLPDHLDLHQEWHVLAEEFLQVDAGLVELAGGEELVGAGEVVGHGCISPNADGRLLYISLRASVDSIIG